MAPFYKTMTEQEIKSFFSLSENKQWINSIHIRQDPDSTDTVECSGVGSSGRWEFLCDMPLDKAHSFVKRLLGVGDYFVINGAVRFIFGKKSINISLDEVLIENDVRFTFERVVITRLICPMTCEIGSEGTLTINHLEFIKEPPKHNSLKLDNCTVHMMDFGNDPHLEVTGHDAMIVGIRFVFTNMSDYDTYGGIQLKNLTVTPSVLDHPTFVSDGKGVLFRSVVLINCSVIYKHDGSHGKNFSQLFIGVGLVDCKIHYENHTKSLHIHRYNGSLPNDLFDYSGDVVENTTLTCDKVLLVASDVNGLIFDNIPSINPVGDIIGAVFRNIGSVAGRRMPTGSIEERWFRHLIEQNIRRHSLIDCAFNGVVSIVKIDLIRPTVLSDTKVFSIFYDGFFVVSLNDTRLTEVDHYREQSDALRLLHTLCAVEYDIKLDMDLFGDRL